MFNKAILRKSSPFFDQIIIAAFNFLLLFCSSFLLNTKEFVLLSNFILFNMLLLNILNAGILQPFMHKSRTTKDDWLVFSIIASVLLCFLFSGFVFLLKEHYGFSSKQIAILATLNLFSSLFELFRRRNMLLQKWYSNIVAGVTLVTLTAMISFFTGIHRFEGIIEGVTLSYIIVVVLLVIQNSKVGVPLKIALNKEHVRSFFTFGWWLLGSAIGFWFVSGGYLLWLSHIIHDSQTIAELRITQNLMSGIVILLTVVDNLQMTGSRNFVLQKRMIFLGTPVVIVAYGTAMSLFFYASYDQLRSSWNLIFLWTAVYICLAIIRIMTGYLKSQGKARPSFYSQVGVVLLFILITELASITQQGLNPFIIVVYWLVSYLIISAITMTVVFRLTRANRLYQEENMSKKEVTFFGSVGYNIGDEAIAIISAKYLKKLNNQLNIRIGTITEGAVKNRYDGIDEFVIDRTSVSGWRNIIDAIKRSDIVVLGGGTMIQDKLGISLTRGMIPYMLQITMIAKYFKKTVITLPIGVDELHTRFGKFLGRQLIKRIDSLNVRDEKSKQLVNAYCPANKNEVNVIADPAFLIDEVMHDEMINDEYINRIVEKPFIALSLVNENIIDQEKTNLFVKLMKEVVSNTDFNILLVPMDRRMSEELSLFESIRQELIEDTDRITILNPDLNSIQISYVLRQAKLLIGMRLHAMIFSVGHIPIIGISRTTKTDTFLKQFGLEGMRIDEFQSWDYKKIAKQIESIASIDSNVSDQYQVKSKLVETLKLGMNTIAARLGNERLKESAL
ncbi:Polysaccharide pyruvyl transferase family protein WcaK [Paenibacillus sp. UNC496MF]|uniref:polysaccharide pyruvyl transferase family protein n=1 Tax=Paenibacillus sp. UNC496MF TaxID=1502753 RepID=UPI0008E8B6C9|nr:polysaccharide pyruvyl transferase family protein [Paenibacillus sp. UNC496MF]SFI88517.1 Polysaccharide pyruvyl transferase family protein WcaK [Paenibacillus sp. UNC496MF]